MLKAVLAGDIGNKELARCISGGELRNEFTRSYNRKSTTWWPKYDLFSMPVPIVC